MSGANLRSSLSPFAKPVMLSKILILVGSLTSSERKKVSCTWIDVDVSDGKLQRMIQPGGGEWVAHVIAKDMSNARRLGV